MKRKYIPYEAGVKLGPNTDKIPLQRYPGVWYVIDTIVYNGKNVFLLEHEEHGDEVAAVIVDENCNMILDCAWNGFDDLNDME